jgi:hypothetical protein
MGKAKADENNRCNNYCSHHKYFTKIYKKCLN